MTQTTTDCRFSIVIPCYNEAAYIAKTLVSLQNQQINDKFEIIVVDNNCCDQTVTIAQRYGARIVTEHQPGVCAARQAGTRAACGEIIISTDADTVFNVNWLKNINRDFMKDKNLIAVGGPCRFFDGPWWSKVYTHFLFGGNYLYYLVTGRPFYVTATNIAFKKSAWHGYNLTVMQGSDELELLHSLQSQGHVKFNNANPTYTSGRRLKRGLLYNFFVTFLFYYIGAYYIDRIFDRHIIGSAPAVRDIVPSSRSRSMINVFLLTTAVMALAILSSPLRNFMLENIEDRATLLKYVIKIVSSLKEPLIFS